MPPATTKDHELDFIVLESTREIDRISWAGKRLLIGRHPDADIRVNEPTMSARHAEIRSVGSRLRLRDLESLNGTLLNGVRVVESHLRPGDRIEIGLACIEVVRRSTSNVPTQPARLLHPDEPPPTAEEKAGLARSVRDTAPYHGAPRIQKEDTGPSTQTVKIQLDLLRQDSGSNLEEDERILLLRDLFEALRVVEDPDRVLAEVRRVLQQAFRNNARTFILRPTDDGEWVDALQQNVERAPSMTFVSEAARSESAILSTSLPSDRRFSAATSVRISGIETAIAAPTSCDGKTVAVLYVDRLGLPPFERRDLNLLGIAANHVSAVLESVSRFAELRRTNVELSQARERLADLNRSLERRVEERTAEIRRQAEEIQELADAKDELLGIAAHDIRGPLTVIQGTVELLRLRAGDLDENTLTRSLNHVHSAARGLSQMLSELLDAKAIEAGKVTLKRQPSRVDELLQSTLPVVQLAADHKNVELVLQVDHHLRIEADPRRLGQAVTNLLLNAVKFSKAGSRILLQGLRAEDRGGDRAEIVVEDQGIGIPKEDLERIFGRFEQGQAGQALGGSGLGLMIARRIVELHEGELSVKSKVGEGTRFVLSLPALRIEEEPVDLPGNSAPIGF